jgi:GNAT superfamily N-acetyltransferase
VSSINIREAVTPSDIDVARSLFRQYVASLPISSEHLWYQNVEQEFATLPGKYAAPRGRILIAWEARPVYAGSADVPAGCVALRPLEGAHADCCEMKRMYVLPSHRGLGLGRRLALAIIDVARSIGYRQMNLDTEPALVEAIALYQSLGFEPIPRYNEDPVPCTMFFGLDLRRDAAPLSE